MIPLTKQQYEKIQHAKPVVEVRDKFARLLVETGVFATTDDAYAILDDFEKGQELMDMIRIAAERREKP